MSGGRAEGHAASFGPGQALLAVDTDKFETTQAAVEAALEEVPRFVCPDCGRQGFSRPTCCAECGTAGERFIRQVPAEAGGGSA
jgi:predicted RNA-binding Zn-ribbon protein involved in translation (DUF1610 family)